MDAISLLFDTSDFPARWECGKWTAGHAWLHILADLGVWSAYVAIPAVLGYFLIRRRNLPFRLIFVLFAAFILACGTTHLMEAVVFWWPAYRLAGAIKLVTAVISWATVIALVPITPRVLAMRSPAELSAEIQGRLHDQESLRLSEERFRMLVEGTTDYAIFMLDAQGKIASWNAGAERICGYRAGEIVGQPFTRLFTAEDLERRTPQQGMEIAARIGRSEAEGWRLRKDGSTFWANGILTPIRDPAGNFKGYWKIIHDLTQRKRTEEKFRGLLESAPDAIVIIQQDGTIALVNRQTEHLFGYARAEMLGQPVEMLIPERYWPKHSGYRSGYFVEPSVRPMGANVNLHARRKDGTEFPVEISLSPLVTDEGVLVSSAIRDVSSRQQAETALEESRRFVERIAEMIPSILYVYDLKEQRNIFVNPRIEPVLGYSVEETLRPGMTVLIDNVHPDDQAKLEWVNEQYQTADDDTVIETEYRLRNAHGQWRWLHIRDTIFVRDSDGHARQILGTALDITDRKRLELEVLEVAASEQRRIGQELHDGTGQELTGLCMLADNLAEVLQEASPAEAKLAHRIALGLRQALGQVRALSKGLVPVEVDAEGLMASLTELTGRIGELHGIRCVFECLNPVPINDNYTATQLFRIAQEAITNALKHAQPSSIRVALETKGPYITLRVTDDGTGLQQTDETQEGIGLRIMRYRAGQIGAHFTIHAGSTRGTTVTCTLFRGTFHD